MNLVNIGGDIGCASRFRQPIRPAVNGGSTSRSPVNGATRYFSPVHRAFACRPAVDGGPAPAPAPNSRGAPGDIWEALGGHVYAALGEYAVRTLLYNAAGLAGAAVSLVKALAPPSVVGPTAVPGNSEYDYAFNIVPTPPDQINPNPTLTGADKMHVVAVYHDALGNVTGWDVFATFANNALATTLSLSNYLAKLPNAPALALPVDVVKVIVNNTPTSFVPNQSFKDKNPDGTGKGNRNRSSGGE